MIVFLIFSFLFFGFSDLKTANAATLRDGSLLAQASNPQASTQSAIVQCGRSGQSMCNLCDLIAGLNNVIQYIMKIAIGVSLFMMTVGGVIYIISAGDSGMIGTAKTTMKNAAIGFIIVFAAYLMVDLTIRYMGTRTNEAGEPTFGITSSSWGRFDCSARP